MIGLGMPVYVHQLEQCGVITAVLIDGYEVDMGQETYAYVDFELCEVLH